MVALGLIAALIAATMFAVGIALQALDARELPSELGLKVSLLARLLRRKRWIAGTVIGTLGWGVQAVALLWAPLAVVQPALTFSLVVLLVLGATALHEPVGAVEIAGVIAIAIGIAGVTLLAPDQLEIDVSTAGLVVLNVGFALLSFSPWLLRALGRSSGTVTIVAAGIAYAWAGIALKLLSDDLSPLAIGGVLLWGAIWSLGGVASLLLEMTAYQTHPATQVAPVVFVLTMLVPVVLSPVLGEHWDEPGLILLAVAVVAAGAVVLGRSRSVGALMAAGHG